MKEKKKIESAEILNVGTELLLGDIVNTDAAFLAGKLALLGIPVYRQEVVGDNRARLVTALREALERSDLVITTGGLGPTEDDLTKETVAEFFGRTMRTDAEILEAIERYFASCGKNMTPNNRKQAMIPEGAVIFKNNNGTAPAIALEGTVNGIEGEKIVILLPGPPNELQPIFNESVMPYLAKRTDETIVSLNINLFGESEAASEYALKKIIEESTNPSVASYCENGTVRLRVTARARDRETAEKMCLRTAEEIKKTEIAKYIYDIDSSSLEESVIKMLRKCRLTLSCAESCTGGLISKRITDIAGCSDVFAGGCVTYSNASKTVLLGVNKEDLEKYGAVSERVALQMAEGVRKKLSTDVGISVTGIAGPGGGTKEKPVGTVWIAISTNEGGRAKLLRLSPMRKRDVIRNLAANYALSQIPEMLNTRVDLSRENSAF